MLKRFFSQSYLYFKGTNSAFSFEEFILLRFSYPILTLIFFVILAAYSFNTSNLAQWVVGNSFLLCVNTALFALGRAFTEERVYGRLRSIIASPESILAVSIQKAMLPMVISIATVFVGFFIGSMVFGINISDINFLLLFSAIIMSMFAISGFGILFATISLLSDNVHLILNTMRFVLLIFSGANFPISQLPDWARIISNIFPLTQGIEAARLLFADFNEYEFWLLLLNEFAVGVSYFLIALIIMKFAERVAVKNANFDLF